MKDFLAIPMILLIIAGLIFLLSIGSKPPGRDLTEKAAEATEEGSGPATNHAGQTIVWVEAGRVNSWISSHRSIRIVSMAGYVRSNYTRGYYIIYEQLPESR